MIRFSFLEVYILFLLCQVDHYRSLLEEIEAKADEREKQFTESKLICLPKHGYS